MNHNAITIIISHSSFGIGDNVGSNAVGNFVGWNAGNLQIDLHVSTNVLK